MMQRLLKLTTIVCIVSTTITMASDNTIKIKMISFNMHGFRQGCSVVEDLIADESPGILLF